MRRQRESSAQRDFVIDINAEIVRCNCQIIERFQRETDAQVFGFFRCQCFAAKKIGDRIRRWNLPPLYELVVEGGCLGSGYVGLARRWRTKSGTRRGAHRKYVVKLVAKRALYVRSRPEIVEILESYGQSKQQLLRDVSLQIQVERNICPIPRSGLFGRETGIAV